MVSYDVIFLHPPSFAEYGRKPWFPGPIARTVGNFSPLFIMIPIGVLSLCESLVKNGFGAKIVNLGEQMLDSPSFKLESSIRDLDSRVFAIDLHWDVHSHGAIRTAEICKQQHPNSFVILGGLTASYFSHEIVSSFDFVDGVIMGETEDAMVALADRVTKSRALANVPNLTYRESMGRVMKNPQAKPKMSIDDCSFTNLSLVEPRKRLLNADLGGRRMKVWNVPVCRGCTFNCVTCGGSEYAYRKMLMRDKPAFRSASRIVDDFHELDEHGIGWIFLFQDCRMGTRSYYEELLKTLHKEKWSKIEHVSMELFSPADGEFTRYLASHKPADTVSLTMSPESGCDEVRKGHGRRYDNDAILRSLNNCRANSINIDFNFMIGLASESFESLGKMWTLWEKILSHKTSHFFTSVDFGPMVLLDPGSIAYDDPAGCGYRMLYKTLSEMQLRLSGPSWLDWINYETLHMTRDDLVESIFKATETWIQLSEKYGVIDQTTARNEKARLSLERAITRELRDIVRIPDDELKSQRLKELDQIYRDPLLSRSYVLTSEE